MVGAGPTVFIEDVAWPIDGFEGFVIGLRPVSERQVLQLLRGGPMPFPKLFERNQALEDPVFMGDSVLAWHLERLLKEGLVERHGELWGSTGKNRKENPLRWLGGYEVKEGGLRWDPASARLV